MATIKQFYVELRSSSPTIPFTPRALESMVRITEASARARLSKSATDDDANRAIRIFRDALKGVSWNEETGTLDIDIIAAGVSHSQQDRMKLILDIIRRNTDEMKPPEQRYPDAALIIREATAKGIASVKVEEALQSLKERGTIYSPRFGQYAAS